MRIEGTVCRQPSLLSHWPKALFAVIVAGAVAACEFSYGFGRSVELAAIPDYVCIARALAAVPDATTEQERVDRFDGIALGGPTPTYERNFAVRGKATYPYEGQYGPAFVDVAFEDYRNGHSSLRLNSIYEYSEPTPSLAAADRDLMDSINKQLTATCNIPRLPPSRQEEALLK